MIRFVDYRKNRLAQSIVELNVVEAVNKYFDLLEVSLLDSVRLPSTLNEGYIGQAAYVIGRVVEEDYNVNSIIIREHINFCKSEFHAFMCEAVDFDSFLNQGGPQGLDGIDDLDKLKRKIRWALDGFKDHIRQLLEPIIGNRTGGSGSQPGTPPPNKWTLGPPVPNQKPFVPPTTPPAASSSSAAPEAPASGTQAVPASGGGGGGGGSSAPAAASDAPWWFRKTQHGPGWWKGSTNLAKSAVKGTWDRLKSGWRGDNLADSVRAEIVNLVETMFTESEQDILGQIDQWTDKLFNYLSQNIEIYAKVAPTAASASSPMATTPSAASTGVMDPARGPGMPVPPQQDMKVGSVLGAAPGTEAVPGKPKRAAPNILMTDEQFNSAIREGKPLTGFMLHSKAVAAGIDQTSKTNLERYNAFRQKLGVPPLETLPKHEPDLISPEELTSYKGMSEDKLRLFAEKSAGRKRLRQLALGYGIEAPHSRNADIWKQFASTIHQKLQSGEQPKVKEPEAAPIAPVTSPAVTPTAPAAGVMAPSRAPGAPIPSTAPVKPVAPSPLAGVNLQAGAAPKKDDEDEDEDFAWLKSQASKTASGSDLGKLAQSMPLEDPDNDGKSQTRVEFAPDDDETDHRQAVEPFKGAQSSTQTQVAPPPQAKQPDPIASEPAKAEEPEFKFGKEEINPYKRTENFKRLMTNDINHFAKGVEVDGGLVNLPDAMTAAPSDEEYSGLVDKLSQEKDGLDKVTDDDLLDAAHDLFIHKYAKTTGKSLDAVASKMNTINQNSAPPEQSPESSSGSDDLHAMFGDVDSAHNDAESRKQPKIDDVMSKMPSGLITQMDDDQKSKMKSYISMRLGEDPNADSQILARDTLRYGANLPRTKGIYDSLNPGLKNQLDPTEMMALIEGMIGKKTMQSGPCENCEGVPGKVEKCPRCRGTGKTTKLTTVPENMIPKKLEEAIVKKKMSLMVEPLTKEPEFEEFSRLWPTDSAARSDLMQYVQKNMDKGLNVDQAKKDAKEYMANSVAQDQAKQKEEDEPVANSYYEPDSGPEEEPDTPMSLTTDRLSNDKIPGTTTTYFDYLTKKLGSDEAVSNAIKDALLKSQSDPNQAMEVLKQKIAELQKTDSVEQKVTTVRDALLTDKAAKDHSYFRILSGQNGNDTQQVNLMIANVLKTTNGDVAQAIELLKRHIESTGAETIAALKDADNTVQSAISNAAPLTPAKKKEPEDMECPFCRGSKIDSETGESCPECGGTGKYKLDDDSSQDDDGYGSDDEDQDEDGNYGNNGKQIDDEDNPDTTTGSDLDYLMGRR